MENAREIVRNAFHLSKSVHKALGNGIYCTPDPETAKTYARDKGKYYRSEDSYLALVQVRVDPTQYTIAKPAGLGPLKDGEYWKVTNGDAIRTYAICLFKR